MSEPLWVYGQYWFADPISLERALLFGLWAPFAVLHYTLTHLDDAIAYMGLAAAVAQPVLVNMSNADGYFANLNGGGLAAEAANAGRAVGIFVDVPTDYGAMWWAVAPDSHQRLAVWQGIVWAALILTGDEYLFYRNDQDPFEEEKRANAYLWFNAAQAVGDMDQNWCGLIGAAHPVFVCDAHDGVPPYHWALVSEGWRDKQVRWATGTQSS